MKAPAIGRHRRGSLLLPALIGVVTTIAVAWSCRLWTDSSIGTRVQFGPQPWRFANHAEWSPCQWRTIQTGFGMRRTRSSSYRPDIDEGSAVSSQVEYAVEVGWPFPALASWHEIDQGSVPRRGFIFSGGAVQWKCALPIPEWLAAKSIDHDGVGLPYRPLAAGLVIDTLFFGAIAWAALVGVRCAVAWRRLRRDRCPRCAHMLAGLSICPECGCVARRGERPAAEVLSAT